VIFLSGLRGKTGTTTAGPGISIPPSNYFVSPTYTGCTKGSKGAVIWMRSYVRGLVSTVFRRTTVSPGQVDFYISRRGVKSRGLRG